MLLVLDDLQELQLQLLAWLVLLLAEDGLREAVGMMVLTLSEEKGWCRGQLLRCAVRLTEDFMLMRAISAWMCKG